MRLAPGTTALQAGKSYDMKGGGGTTTVIVNPFTRQMESEFVSLSGTTVNCAGGVHAVGLVDYLRRDERRARPMSQTRG